MFARHVFMHLKPNSVAEFTRMLDQEIIPVLRKRRGFQDEIAFVVPGGTEAVGISLWDRKEDADAYNRRTYPQVLKALWREWSKEILIFKPMRCPTQRFTC